MLATVSAGYGYGGHGGYGGADSDTYTIETKAFQYTMAKIQ